MDSRLSSNGIDKSRFNQIKTELNSYVSNIRDLQVVSDSIVHLVIKVIGDSTVYLKMRGAQFADLPHIKTSPDAIDAEARALTLFAETELDYFPAIIHYDKKLYFLLLTDVMPGGVNMRTMYDRNKITRHHLTVIAGALADIHTTLRGSDTDVRQGGDMEFLDQQLDFHFNIHNSDYFSSAAREIAELPRQLILGDLSPKNIYVNDTVARFCDFDSACLGPVVYDLAWIMAHIILHSRQASVHADVAAFMKAYTSTQKTKVVRSDLLYVAIEAMLLYRLQQIAIPYNLDLDDTRRQRMISNLLQNQTPKPNLNKLLDNLFK